MNINKAFKKQVDKCMNNTFGPITQSYIKTTLEKKTTWVLSLLMFYETIKNPKKAFILLSYVIYTTISNYVCINFLSCE